MPCSRICEHIIRHYNEGWADGFHYDIEYWEIWNEPDLDVKEGRQFTDPRTWAGTLEQFNELYVTAACHLRSCFPDIKIGGPAYASPLRPMGDFLDCIKKHGAPLDFFSWHRYDSIPEHYAYRAAKVREQLDVKGFTETESILNEWNYVRSWRLSVLRSRLTYQIPEYMSALLPTGKKSECCLQTTTTRMSRVFPEKSVSACQVQPQNAEA